MVLKSSGSMSSIVNGKVVCVSSIFNEGSSQLVSQLYEIGDSLVSNPSETVINTSVQACCRVSKRLRKGLMIRMKLLVEVLEGVRGDTVHSLSCIGVDCTGCGLSMGRKLFLQLAKSVEESSMRKLEL
ncbi:hypothetical protein OXX59_001903 [Metschnikowia pulcherrima]